MPNLVINHFGGYRARVVGSGNLKGTVYSFDKINSSVLTSHAMAATTARPANILANFTDTKIKLRLETTEIDEIFNIHEITVYIKPLYQSYPQ